MTISPTCHRVTKSPRWTVAALAIGLFAASLCFGCGPAPSPRPPNPVLEDSLDALHALEARQVSLPSRTPADELELGIARYRVWSIYLARSRFSDDKADWNRRQAERWQPLVSKPFIRLTNCGDPAWQARGWHWQSRLSLEAGDLGYAETLLRHILDKYAAVSVPAEFGLCGRPQFLCYHELAGIYRARNDRVSAVDSMARSLLAIDACATTQPAAVQTRQYVLRELLAYEPRVVLASFHRWLPESVAGVADASRPMGPALQLAQILREHRERAANRISLVAEHMDANGILVRYAVEFPAYGRLIGEWEKSQQDRPRIRLPDDFSHVQPGFYLVFTSAGGPAGGFVDSKSAREIIAQPAYSQVLKLGGDCRAEGRIILPWSADCARGQQICITATLMRRQGYPMGPARPADEIFCQPIEVIVPNRFHNHSKLTKFSHGFHGLRG